MKKRLWPLLGGVLIFFLLSGICMAEQNIVDAMDRTIAIPSKVERVICSGPGCLRLLTYLQAQDRIVGVDDMETRRSRFDARPYALAHPEFKEYPEFGSFRGHDNPEQILVLDPQPQVIFKTFAALGHDPIELSEKTGIPVIVLNYGDLGANRDQLFQALRIMGKALGQDERAENVIAFFEEAIDDLHQRTYDIPGEKRPSCFVGGIASKGPHGYQSTEPGYPPLAFIHADNVAYDTGLKGKALLHSSVAKEKIVEWDPDILFLDLSTLQMGDKVGGLHELGTDPAYQSLKAVQQGKVYGVLPYNWYSGNYGSILANAYYMGKLLYPDRFEDVDPRVKADDIYGYLIGKGVFGIMDQSFQGLAFQPIPLN
ncbi:MAG: iron ABC transporter substrate-binding protein [Desulfatibacillum sp.]|nr:iron ABC transporter substrate-binding protein [Desulfatibacillum sp.]